MRRKTYRRSTMVILGLLSVLSFGLVPAQTPNYVPLWLGGMSRGDSVIYQTSNGRIGIGTTNPGGKLHIVEGNAFVKTEMSSSGLPISSFRGPEVHGSPGRLVLYGSTAALNANLYYDSAMGMYVQDNPAYPSAAVGVQEGLVDLATASAGGPITSRLRVIENGNVGIGTGDPAAKLHVAASGIGVYGTSTTTSAVWGESTGTTPGADGVHGVAHGPASGVAGVNTEVGGVGVWGQSPGWSFFSTGDVHQERTGGGWVKAMVSVNALNPPYRIVRCFNSALAGPDATTPPCGINFTEGTFFGFWNFDFGFRVDDRFYSARLTQANPIAQILASHSSSESTTVQVATHYAACFLG